MSQSNQTQPQPLNPAAFARPMLLGAGIGLVAILFFLVGAEAKPEWGKLWMIRPLIIVPLAGAVGGLFFQLMEHYLGYRGGWRKAAAIVISVLVFIIGLWMGIVLGLEGTLWD